MKYSIHVRCACPEGKDCPKLWRKDGSWDPRHGSAGFACRIPTSESDARLLKRFGYKSKTDASTAAEAVGKLLDLAADDVTRAKIGDMIAAVKRGGQLPAAEDVRRRLGLGQDPASAGVTFGEAWSAWLSGNKKLRASSRRRLEQIGEHWLLPVLAEIPLERLNGTHCTAVFERIDAINGEIISQKAGGVSQVRPEGDVRQHPQAIGVATQHRVFAALRTVLNFEVKVTHRLPFNPVYAVQLEPEETPEAERYSMTEAARFIAASKDDPLGLMFRVAVLRGPRRAEMVGFRWSASDLDAGYLGVRKTVLQLGGTIVQEDKAKTPTSKRKVWLDAETIRLLREHRETQDLERQFAGGAWEDNDLVFCRDDGRPWPPDYVSRRFKAIARAAGLRPIKLHEGSRHTARSIGDDIGVDPDISQRTGGWATKAMSDHYNHPEAERYRQAAEDVARHVKEAGS